MAAENRSRCEAQRIYPDPAHFSRQIDLSDRLLEEYTAHLADSYGITIDDLNEVANEGIDDGWPPPPFRSCEDE